tara:strand:- start:929 stop:2608 length:1680 start_codon:yes stop_codon:yes gene_type:complete
MFGFIKTIIRIQAILPDSYKNTSKYFFGLSLLLLVLDVFSIFLLIPLIISLLNQGENISFLFLDYFNDYKLILVVVVILFFLVKNYIAIKINKYQAKVAYNLSSEYSLSLSKYYMLGNYLTFKKQKKSSIIKEIIFVANDFVVNVLLSVNTILSELILLIIILLFGFYFYFYITLIVVVILGLIIFLSKLYNRKAIENINKTRSADYENNISNLVNLLNGFMSIKSPKLLNHFLDTFYESNKRLNYNYSLLHSKRVNSSKQTEIIMVIMLGLIFTFIHLFSLKGSGAVVFLSIFGTLFFKAIPSVNKLNIGITNLHSHFYSLNIIEKKIVTISKITSNKTPLTYNSSIELKNITFSYQEKVSLLSDINLTIKKGDFIAINGVSGVGKTTLLNIISKLIDPSSGKILIDGIEVTNTNKYNYFSLITYLTQRPFIYEGTIFDNLLLNKKQYNQKKLSSILSSLDLLDTINLFPEKLNTFIGIEGSALSGGQLQRLSIARALMNNPEILILDEATNNLDKATENMVLNYLKIFTKETNTTIISVSHNLEIKKELFDTIINLD